ncbi:MAG: hypothetical protein OEL53_08130 [Rhodospirillales bacterium]|nr:hypothetical protein [Rhodospirillales bacterium]
MGDVVTLGAMGIGYLFLGALALALAAEGLLRAFTRVYEALFVEKVSRKDYYDPGCHDYVDWLESWHKPIFNYLSIGFRLFNNDNPIPGRIRTNPLGYRCDPICEPKPDQLRIVVLGGSTAWGLGASSNEATVAGQLEALLNKPGVLGKKWQSCKVYNLAQCKATATQDMLSLLFHGTRMKPHITITLGGWNELASCNMRTGLLRLFRAFYVVEQEGWEPPQVAGHLEKTLKQAMKGWLRSKSLLARRLIPAEMSAHQGASATVAQMRDQISVGSEILFEHMDHMNRLGSAYGFKHFHFFQPHLYSKKAITPEEMRVMDLYDNVRPTYGGPAIGDHFRTANIYDQIMAMCADAGWKDCKAIDLSRIFAEDAGHIFFSIVHCTDDGYNKLAKSILQTLIDERALS